jgi:hypothetical protein
MVERSISWLVADGCRRVPYHGIKRNHVWLSVRVAALNLRRLLILVLPGGMGPGCWPDRLARPHPAERDPGHRKPVGCANADMASELAVRSMTPR